MKLTQYLNRYCNINVGYNFRSTLLDYCQIDIYKFEYRETSKYNTSPIQISVAYVDEVVFTPDEQKYVTFEFKADQFEVLTHRLNTFSNSEIQSIKNLILSNQSSFNFETCKRFSDRKKHYKEISESSSLYKDISKSFNPCDDWELSTILWLYAEVNFYNGCTRDFFNDAVNFAKNNRKLLEKEILEDQADFFGYDNPPKQDEYWDAYNTPVTLERLGIKSFRLFKVDGLNDIYCIEYNEKVNEYKGKVNFHLVKRNGVYHPFKLPCQFYSSSICNYIQ